MNILDTIQSPADVKKLNDAQLEQLCKELRVFLVETVSKTGGHIASNLGVVELTVALHRVFLSPQDKIVWDVGHQCYVHKILTGRKEQFHTIRTYGGLSGFPKTTESPHDVFNTGHSSTSISAAFGIAQANKLEGKNDFSIAVIGDGALTGGLAFEALNNAGRSDTNLIVILNDNEMSISKNVGNMNKYLNKLRTEPFYSGVKRAVEATLDRIPAVGKPLARMIYNTKSGIKHLFLPGTLFEELGFTYIGPIDGHDLKLLTTVLERAKYLKKPVFIHVVTKKGKGYLFAEKSPQLYHGTSGYDVKKPIEHSENQSSYSHLFGRKLVSLARLNPQVVAVTAAMGFSTGLADFKKEYPSRYFDVGISEGHAVTFCCGLASMGKVPVVPIYSTFMQRAYDNIIHDLALQNLHVVLCLDRAGLVGDDGETHHGIFDVSFLTQIPNLKVFTPYTQQELACALETAVQKEKGPVAIRYPRGTAPAGPPVADPYQAVTMREGSKVTVVTMSRMTGVVRQIAFDGDHLHLNCIKPVDVKTIARSVKKTGKLITIEDNLLAGGMGECVSRALEESGVQVPTRHYGIDDTFVTHGKIHELLKELGLDPESLEGKCNE